MNIVLWVLQVALAVAFVGAGVMKLSQPKEKLAANMGWVERFPAGAVKGIGGLEVLAALGLTVPAAVGVATVLTPLAATGLALLMVGAAITHARLKEFPMIGINAVLFVLSAIVAWGRFGPYHF